MKQLAGLAAALAVAFGCGPVVDPSAAAVAPRCNKTCLASCADSCLPTGYCARAASTLAAKGVTRLAPATAADFSLDGFPPAVRVRVMLHAGLDIAERGAQVPASLTIAMFLNGEHAVDEVAERSSTFPSWKDYQSTFESGADGRVRLHLSMERCSLELPGVCTFDPASTITAEVVSPGPWLLAPLCE